MYRFSRIFRFEAAHRLDYLPPEHKCNRLHGHSYTVIVTMAARDLDQDAFVLEAEKMQPFAQYIDGLDHTYLNETLGNAHATTCESLSRSFYHEAARLLNSPNGRAWVLRVRVHETPRHYAEFGD